MESVVEALRSKRHISGLTHQYYRYPAAFSPYFVRHAIEEYTSPGDVVLDPFVGGGTSVVESLAAGRLAVGFDLNALAVFVAGVKTRPLSRNQWLTLEHWADSCRETDERAPFPGLPGDAGVFVARAMTGLQLLSTSGARSAARCSLLRLGQWALESRKTAPCEEDCRAKLVQIVADMESGMAELVESAAFAHLGKRRLVSARRLVHGSADEPSTFVRGLDGMQRRPRLVLMSPPYPRVHVLYNRWQVDGRRETAAPYGIAGCQDGLPSSYYTMGARTVVGEENYFVRIAAVFALLRRVIHPGGHVVQVVGFNRAETQLDRYAEVVAANGFVAEDVSGIDRAVPNRRWYARGTTSDSGREYLLVHRIQR